MTDDQFEELERQADAELGAIDKMNGQIAGELTSSTIGVPAWAKVADLARRAEEQYRRLGRPIPSHVRAAIHQLRSVPRTCPVDYGKATQGTLDLSFSEVPQHEPAAMRLPLEGLTMAATAKIVPFESFSDRRKCVPSGNSPQDDVGGIEGQLALKPLPQSESAGGLFPHLTKRFPTAFAPTQRVRRGPTSVSGQGTPDFLPPAAAKPRTLGTTVEAVIYCEDPVASRLHRTIAVAVDWSIILLAYGLFLVVFRLCGGQFVLNKANLILLGSVLPLLSCFYGLMYAILGKETTGMHWANLRLTTFDGLPPERDQRVIRLCGSVLSWCTVVGLLWSFADEESLTWPDHISGTFPTPRRLESEIFHRR